MKTVILAGGLGSRLGGESLKMPKPMVKIGELPIIVHLIKHFRSHGHKDFIICAGYMAETIKDYFRTVVYKVNDISVDLSLGSVECMESSKLDWRVQIVDTGEKTATGGRLKRVGHLLEKDQPFFFTYGDGLSNVDLASLQNQHQKMGKLATVTAVIPPPRFGSIRLDGNLVKAFEEKPQNDALTADVNRINGGFFVLQPSVLDLIKGDETIWEQEPLKELVRREELAAYIHDGFWQPMDTPRDRDELTMLYDRGSPPWQK